MRVLLTGSQRFTLPATVDLMMVHACSCGPAWLLLGCTVSTLLDVRHCVLVFVTLQVMRRIVDDSFQIGYPPYLSAFAKDLISRLLERKPALRIGARLCCCW